MKNLKKSWYNKLWIVLMLVVLLSGTLIYYKTSNSKVFFTMLSLFSIIVGLFILNGKEKLFLDDCELKFFNNEKAWKKAYKVWAICFFVIGILLFLNIFTYFYIGNIIPIAIIISIIITLFYMFKFRK